MHLLTLSIPFRSSTTSSLGRIPNPSYYKFYASHRRHLSTSAIVPHLQAPSLVEARSPKHTSLIASRLQEQGIVKVTLGFNDPQSTYLQHLIDTLHRHHGHKLPISHSASRGWFWDVRPANHNFQTENHQARSETMNEFPWHTDCSYENPTPRFFALQVLRHDHFGGGTLSVTNVVSLTDMLSESTRRALQKDEFQIHIPGEFIKKAEQKSITGRILARSHGQSIMRFRQDILTPLTDEASAALDELNGTLKKVRSSNHAIHLTAEDLPTGSVILVDNFRWLHARNHVKDPERHLRRVRWDAIPFGSDP